jgi:hypothetical protein
MQEDYNFGQLYRAALAETDPGRKSELLREVQLILLNWHDTARPAPQKPDGPEDSVKDPAA